MNKYTRWILFFFISISSKIHLHIHIKNLIYIYIYICGVCVCVCLCVSVSVYMGKIVNWKTPTRCEKINGKVDKPNIDKRIKIINITSLSNLSSGLSAYQYPGRTGFNPTPKTQKIVLSTALLNTQHFTPTLAILMGIWGDSKSLRLFSVFWS